MNFLSIDCSTDVGSLFVKIKNKTFSKALQSDKSNNDLLMYQILDFLKKYSLAFEDISEILVNKGPGNFSGLRGSLSTAKGISLSKNIKLYGYDNFIWQCVKFHSKQDSIFSIIKFREKYYVKQFSGDLTSSSREKEVSERQIIQEYSNKFKVIEKNASNSFDDKILKLNNLKIVQLDHNDLELLKLKGLLNKDLIIPIYLS